MVNRVHLSNVSPCSLKTVLQVAEYGTMPTSPFSLPPFVSYRVLQKICCRELNICKQHTVGKDSVACGPKTSVRMLKLRFFREKYVYTNLITDVELEPFFYQRL